MDTQTLKKLGGAGAVALAGVAGAIGLFNTSLYNGKRKSSAFTFSFLGGPLGGPIRNSGGKGGPFQV